MTNREYLEDQDAEEPDDFIISLTAQVSTIFFFQGQICIHHKKRVHYVVGLAEIYVRNVH